MQLVILDQQHIRLDTADGDDELAIQGGPFGPLQMLAASLALCTLSVVASYAETARLDIGGMAVEVAWTYADGPYRVGRYDLMLHLPEAVPASRHRAIIRAADTCTVHQTMLHAPAFETGIRTLVPGQPLPQHEQHHHHHHADEA